MGKKKEAARRAEKKATAKITSKGDGSSKKAPKSSARGLKNPLVDALRWQTGRSITECDTRSTPGWSEGRKEAERALSASHDLVAELQERLYAQARGGAKDSVLLVIQGMDTSGKGGAVRHVVGACDPQGVRLTSFKAPTPEERAHPFLWRIRRALPTPGEIGVFDRSHYEDVLIARVQELVPRSVWARRYNSINTFERTCSEQGITLIKVMMHISAEEQHARLRERLERPDKWWKYNPGDIDQRERWNDYQEAYQAVLDRTSTEHAPWYVVPADRKWYARIAVQSLLLAHLQQLDPQWPPADFDPQEELARLNASHPAS